MRALFHLLSTLLWEKAIGYHVAPHPLRTRSSSIYAEHKDGRCCDKAGDPQRRRTTAAALIAASVGGCGFPAAGAARALSPEGVAGSNDDAVGESVRRAASRVLPGMGPPDVYYPASFQGIWSNQWEILPAAPRPTNDNSASSSGAAGITSRTVEYRVRYLPAFSLDQERVAVADRGYNQANLAAALDGGAQRVQAYTWSQQNPNDLRLIWSSGLVQDYKVTKRASERTNETVSSSEFVRWFTIDESSSGIPTISARRVLSKYRTVTENRIEGIELEYGVPDPGAMPQPTAAPTLLTKSRIVLTRGSVEN
jgi:hypothetical protein